MLNKDGFNLIQLGTKQSKEVTDFEGQRRMVHSLGKPNYLKIEQSNHILYSF